MNNYTKARTLRPRARVSRNKPPLETNSAEHVSVVANPARQFLITIGWLRLLQAVAFESYVLPAQRPARYET